MADRPQAAGLVSEAPMRARAARIGVLVVIAVACAIAALALPPIAQTASYHAFADGRTLLGVPNFWNVATNVAILAAGIVGFRAVAMGPAGSGAASRPCWLTLFAGFVLTAFGSTWYHWAPDSARLVWDRLPMTIAFMSLLAAMIADRIDARAGRTLLLPLLAVGIASVAWWQWTMTHGREDVGPYAFVQFAGVVLVLLGAVLFPRAGSGGRGTAPIVAAALVYLGAKGAEHLDDRIYALGGLVSGHSIKHLLVGLVGFQLLHVWRVTRERTRAA